MGDAGPCSPTLLTGPAGLPSANPTKAFWQTSHPNPVAKHRSTPGLPATADIVVIGTGISGTFATHEILTTAAAAAGQALNVVVLEARTTCSAATGRNGGHCQPLVHAERPAIIDFEMRNYAHIRDLVKLHDVPCDFRQIPGVLGFWNKTYFDEAKAALQGSLVTAEHRKLVEVVEAPEELQNLRLTGGVVGAIVQTVAASLSPYKLMIWLWGEMIKEYERSEGGGGRWEGGGGWGGGGEWQGGRGGRGGWGGGGDWRGGGEWRGGRGGGGGSWEGGGGFGGGGEWDDGEGGGGRWGGGGGGGGQWRGGGEWGGETSKVTLNLQTETPVASIQEVQGGHGWTVKTSRGEVHAKQVILATNAYTSHLMPEFEALISPVQAQMSALLPPQGSPFRERLIPMSYGMMGVEGQDRVMSDYLVQNPILDEDAGGVVGRGGHLMFGGGRAQARGNGVGVSDDDYVDPDAEAYLRSLPEHLNLEAEEEAGGAPQTTTGTGTSKSGLLDIAASWTGIIGSSADGHPWVGGVPGRDGLFVAAGYSGHGMTNAGLCGRHVAQLALKSLKGEDWKALQAHGVELAEQGKGGVPREYVITQERIDAARGVRP
ncbi:hypothetical protein PV08_09381 [Exophiala spinifera]|uniref:FAD dependent oxidoreductase domain-containing protein n=1 Tax=Exophiala spinifera TaxID=91928 RepID=A0A0D1ZGK7_9EURO|nr:uncharacterized protein PV08_09381 [Exophiala spinifera]KIW12107.1 hypothetical protein PV08_09381 [Exophiala spinifera]